MVKSDAVELLEGINELATRCRQTRVQRYPFEVHLAGCCEVHALALLNVAEVDRVSPFALVGHDGWLHVSDQSPLRRPEEGMGLDVRCAGFSA